MLGLVHNPFDVRGNASRYWRHENGSTARVKPDLAQSKGPQQETRLLVHILNMFDRNIGSLPTILNDDRALAGLDLIASGTEFRPNEVRDRGDERKANRPSQPIGLPVRVKHVIDQPDNQLKEHDQGN